MAITLSERYLSELDKNVNTPNVVVELELDSGIARYGFHGRNTLPTVRFLAGGEYTAGGGHYGVGTSDLESLSVRAVLKSVSSLQNRLDPRAGYSTRGQMKVVLSGIENLAGLVPLHYLLNRRLTRKDGFISPGFTYGDYAPTFTGRVVDWSRSSDDLTLVVADDLKDASKKIPVENSAKTQHLDYRDLNPVDIMTDILSDKLALEPEVVDTERFTEERDTWLNGWRFARVVTEPEEANTYLNELQRETNSFIVHDGEKVSFKVFAPPAPGISVEQWTDRDHIIKDTLKQKSGYRDGFYNRVVLYYDYDESGSDKEENFESAVISADASSQSATQWGEVKTRVIKSRWIRTLVWDQPVELTGVVIYFASRANGTSGAGELDYVSSTRTLRWKAPGGSYGEGVTLTRDGKYKLFDADKTRYLRVVVDASVLPGWDATDTIGLRPLHGQKYASCLAAKTLSLYRDPAATVTFSVDINNVAFTSKFVKPTDLKDLSTGEAFSFGSGEWSGERVMLTSVRPDFSKNVVSVEAVQTKMYRRYGFIAPAGCPDYGSASEAERSYAFIGDSENKVGGSAKDGYYCW